MSLDTLSDSMVFLFITHTRTCLKVMTYRRLLFFFYLAESFLTYHGLLQSCLTVYQHYFDTTRPMT